MTVRTMTFDGSTTWAAFFKTIPHGETTEVIVKARPGGVPYTDPTFALAISWPTRVIIRPETSIDIHDALHAPASDWPQLGAWFLGTRFPMTTRSPGERRGVRELRGVRIIGAGGDAVNEVRGHSLLEALVVDGTGAGVGDPPRGGTSGISTAHSYGEPGHTILDNCISRYRGSHGVYGGEKTSMLVRGGYYHSTLGGYDAWRSLAWAVLMGPDARGNGTRITTTDPYPPLNPKRMSSMLLGTMACANAVIIGAILTRIAEGPDDNQYMAAARARQSLNCANRRWVGIGNETLPIEDAPGWEWFGPKKLDARGLRLPDRPDDPRFWFDPAYWRMVRAAGLDRFDNPHLFKHIYAQCTFINHGGNGGIAILNEGTAPCNEEEFQKRQDHYMMPLPVDEQGHVVWCERCAIWSWRNTFQAEPGPGKPFQRYRGRRASAWTGEANSAWENLDGTEGEGDGTLGRIIEIPDEVEPPWMRHPHDAVVRAMAGLTEIWPEYKDYVAQLLGGSGDQDTTEPPMAGRPFTSRPWQLVEV